MPYDMGTVEGDSVDWFTRSLAMTGEFVANVRGDQWEDPTPCSEWNVTQLVHHLVGNNVWFAAAMRGDDASDGPPKVDLLGADPLGAYTRSATAANDAMATPGAMERVLPYWGGVVGRLFTAEHFVDCFIHGWDLAKATGQDTRLPSDLVQKALEIVTPGNGQPAVDEVWDFVDVPAPQTTDVQAVLLARTGRTP